MSATCVSLHLARERCSVDSGSILLQLVWFSMCGSSFNYNAAAFYFCSTEKQLVGKINLLWNADNGGGGERTKYVNVGPTDDYFGSYHYTVWQCCACRAWKAQTLEPAVRAWIRVLPYLASVTLVNVPERQHSFCKLEEKITEPTYKVLIMPHKIKKH